MLTIDVKNKAFAGGLPGLVLAMLFGVCLMLGCSRPELALSGTFVNEAKSEFSVAHDTLVVSRVSGPEYRIDRSTGIGMLDESGKVTRRLLEREVWKAVYDAETQVLTEQKRGRRIRYQADGLVLEESRYRQID